MELKELKLRSRSAQGTTAEAQGPPDRIQGDRMTSAIDGIPGSSPHLQPWVSPEFAEYLGKRSGIPEIEKYIVDADQVVAEQSVAEKAVSILERDGIVLIRNALDAEQIASLRGAITHIMEGIDRIDPDRTGSRGPKRHSIGGCSSTKSQLHHPEFAAIVDVPAVIAVLTTLWGSLDFACRSAGGDICLAGALEHQILHSDLGLPLYGCEKIPVIAVNFLLEDQTPFNAPLRHIPGTQRGELRTRPHVGIEPEEMLLSTMCPAPAGTALIRDIRTWHGGTPNLTTCDRPLPNVEFLAPFVLNDPDLFKADRLSKAQDRPQISHADWSSLPWLARHLTRLVKAKEGQEVNPVPVMEHAPGFTAMAPLFKCCKENAERAS